MLEIWIGFSLFVLVMLAIDLGRKARAVSLREAAAWSAAWVSLAFLFALGIALFWDRWQPARAGEGSDKAIEFVTGYVIELSLSVDNLFVFLVIFQYFGVPEHLRHRALLWGIVLAIIFRILFILVGATLLHYFHWVTYIFGAFLIYTAYKLFRSGDDEVDPDKNVLLRLARRLFLVVSDYDSPRFWVKREGRWHATPMALVLLVIGSTDLVFALDSIPAVFGVTKDLFIVVTSNVFAVLGLRSLYFLLSGILGLFRYLKAGLSLLLGFVGLKMILEEPLHAQLEEWGIGQREKIIVSLGGVVLILGGAVVASLLAGKKEPGKE